MPDDSEFEKNLTLNYSKFAVECDGNSKISQTHSKLRVFLKMPDFFQNR